MQICNPLRRLDEALARFQPGACCRRGFTVEGGAAINDSMLAGLQEAVFQPMLPKALYDLCEGTLALLHLKGVIWVWR